MVSRGIYLIINVPDVVLNRNRDSDPSYLMADDFYEFKELWSLNVSDSDLVTETNNIEHCCPIVEDISLDDNILYLAVEQINNE